MSTNSYINVKVGDKYHAVYCHWDGYLSHNGRILLQNYNSQELAEKLVSLGDMSSLAESCECPEGHSYTTPVKGFTVYYGRDRGETDTSYQVIDKPIKFSDGSYVYTWDGARWFIGSKELTEELIANS